MDDLWCGHRAILARTWGGELEEAIANAKMVAMDANMCEDDLAAVVRMCKAHGTKVWFEPTSAAKCGRIVRAGVVGEVWYMSPNEVELEALGRAVGGREGRGDGEGDTEKRLAEEVLSRRRTQGQTLLVTRGKRGVMRAQMGGAGVLLREEFAGAEVGEAEMGSTTGAGDCFAGRCVGGLATGEAEEAAIAAGVAAASASCRTRACVPARAAACAVAKL